MDARWWVWIGLALFAGLFALVWFNAPKSPGLEAIVLTLSDLPQSLDRATLARTPAGKLEYRRVRERLVPYFHQKSHEFSYILQGRAVGFIKNERVEAEAGRLLVAPRLTAIGLRKTSAEPLELLSFYAPAPDALDEVQVLIGDIFPPGDPSSLWPQALPANDRDLVLGMLDLSLWSDQHLANVGAGWEWGYLAKNPLGSVALVRVTARLQLKEHATHFLYLRRGQARITVGERVLEATTGQLAILPAGSARTIERVGDELLEFLLFSAPALQEKNILSTK